MMTIEERNRLLLSHLPLIRRIIKHWWGSRGARRQRLFDIEELSGVCAIVFLEECPKHHPERCSFEDFIVPRIYWAMAGHWRTNDPMSARQRNLVKQYLDGNEQIAAVKQKECKRPYQQNNIRDLIPLMNITSLDKTWSDETRIHQPRYTDATPRWELLEEAYRAMELLTDRERLIWLMRHYDGESIRTICKQVGLSRPRVDELLFKIRRKIQNAIKMQSEMKGTKP